MPGLTRCCILSSDSVQRETFLLSQRRSPGYRNGYAFGIRRGRRYAGYAIVDDYGPHYFNDPTFPGFIYLSVIVVVDPVSAPRSLFLGVGRDAATAGIVASSGHVVSEGSAAERSDTGVVGTDIPVVAVRIFQASGGHAGG